MENGGDFMQLCRLCLVKDQVNIPIFEDQGDIRQIFLKISSCLPVKIAPNDKLPKKICDGCSYKLDMLYEFWNTSANAEKQLVTWLDQAGLKANTETADKTMSVVAQQCSNKPSETIVKQEAMEDAAENQIFMQEMNYKEKWDEASSSAGPSATVTSDEPPPKRARRAAAVKASLNVTPESEDEDDDFDNEAMTKIENESDEEDDDDDMDDDSAYADVPSTSADDQAGPSGVGKDGVEAPSPFEEFRDYQCYICGQIYENDEDLRVHLENLEAFLKIYCDQCNTFISLEDALFHRQTTYFCSQCKLMLTKETFLDHGCLHDNEYKALALSFKQECTQCKNYFFSKLSLEKHMNEKHGSKILNCKCCKLHFIDVELFNKHRLNHYRNAGFVTLKEEGQESKLQEKLLNLINRTIKRNKELCEMRDKNNTDFTREMKQEKLDVLNLRNKSVFKAGSFDSNLTSRESISNDEINQCYICGQIFGNGEDLRFHLENLEAFLKVYCKQCKSFVTFEESIFHLQITYSCSLCKLILPQGTFLEHDCLHKSSNQLLAMSLKQECNSCDKIFFCDLDIQKHIEEVHSNNKPKELHCKCCKLTFSSKEMFKMHVSGHYKRAGVLNTNTQSNHLKNDVKEDKGPKKASPNKKKKNGLQKKTKTGTKKKAVIYQTMQTRSARIQTRKKVKILPTMSKKDKFCCGTCHKVFKTSHLLVTHKRKH
ncbi:unnamed protein product [Brassicogethes aeneus]|uniref:Uncharacterized protein n=1 Tax=Brassicogethes aeneus TaxID=1431903 RepID=A0A9P0AM20_BRAAE|nr:unnamed protein product [Brassicogethes aeneus]